jgi:hypothetical protein
MNKIVKWLSGHYPPGIIHRLIVGRLHMLAAQRALTTFGGGFPDEL